MYRYINNRNNKIIINKKSNSNKFHSNKFHSNKFHSKFIFVYCNERNSCWIKLSHTISKNITNNNVKTFDIDNDDNISTIENTDFNGKDIMEIKVYNVDSLYKQIIYFNNILKNIPEHIFIKCNDKLSIKNFNNCYHIHKDNNSCMMYLHDKEIIKNDGLTIDGDILYDLLFDININMINFTDIYYISDFNKNKPQDDKLICVYCDKRKRLWIKNIQTCSYLFTSETNIIHYISDDKYVVTYGYDIHGKDIYDFESTTIKESLIIFKWFKILNLIDIYLFCYIESECKIYIFKKDTIINNITSIFNNTLNSKIIYLTNDTFHTINDTSIDNNLSCGCISNCDINIVETMIQLYIRIYSNNINNILQYNSKNKSGEIININNTNKYEYCLHTICYYKEDDILTYDNLKFINSKSNHTIKLNSKKDIYNYLNKNKLSDTYAIILRGHIRDSFKNNNLNNFLIYLIDKGLDIDIYIQTWSYLECHNGHSWRETIFDDSIIIDNKYVLNYFDDKVKKYIKQIIIINEKDIELTGETEGLIGNKCSTNKKGWKNMWYGIHKINECVYDSNKPYLYVINTRIDFFSDKIISRRRQDYIYQITYEYLYQLFIDNKKNNDNIIFLKNSGPGVDNYYMGPIQYIYKLSYLFNHDFDETIIKCAPQYKQEIFVYETALYLKV
jgi:hypothetical protein